MTAADNTTAGATATVGDTVARPTPPLVRDPRDIDEVRMHGAVHVRMVYDATVEHFASSLQFVLVNRIAAGDVNDRHVHDSTEKAHYVIAGTAELECGDTVERVDAGRLFFFPARVPHRIRNIGSEDFVYVVFGAEVLGDH